VHFFPIFLTFKNSLNFLECVAFVGSGVVDSQIITSLSFLSKDGKIPSIPFVHRFGGIAIVSVADNRICQNTEEGEIWLCNPSVARGYWNRPELTKETFQNILPDYESSVSGLSLVAPEGKNSSFWLRTGDFGYFEKCHLFVSGRLKDLIITNGRNYYPQDIENAVQAAHDSIKPGCVAAFSVKVEDTEGYIVVCEIRTSYLHRHTKAAMWKDVVRAVSKNLTAEGFPEMSQLVFIKERSIPKTTSGKIRRKETKSLWTSNTLQVIQKFPDDVKLSSNLLHNDDSHDNFIDLDWIDLDVTDILSVVNSQTFKLSKCKSIFKQFNIYEKDVSLINQGIDSLKVHELLVVVNDFLSSTSSSSNRADLQVDFNVVFEWTGHDLLSAFCGIVPDKSNSMKCVFPMYGPSDRTTNLPVLFFFHSLLGIANSYQHVLLGLRNHYNIYGLSSPNVTSNRDHPIFYESLNDLVSDYIRRIKAVQPKGPYNFSGFCFGCLISLEVTRRLQECGEVVECLVLFDNQHGYYRELMSRSAFQIVYETRLGVGDESTFLTKNSYHHIQLILNCGHPKPLLRPVSKFYFLKTEGNLPLLACLENSHLEWNFLDLLQGTGSFLHPDQRLLIGPLFCNHNALSSKDPACTEIVLRTLNDFFEDAFDSKRLETFQVNKHEENILVALRLHSTVLMKGIFQQALEVDLLNKQYLKEKKSLLHLAIMNDQIDIANYLLREGIDTGLKDEGGFTAFDLLRKTPSMGDYSVVPINWLGIFQYYQIVVTSKNSRGIATIEENDLRPVSANVLKEQITRETVGERAGHSLNLSLLFGNTKEILTIRFICRSLLAVFGQSFPFLCANLISLTYRLLLLRLLSASSLNVLAGYILDDGVFKLFQLNSPLLHYLNAAFDRSNTTDIRNAFHSGWLLGLTMAVPLFIYCGVARHLGNAIGMDPGVTSEWSNLAWFHMIGVLPLLTNITLEAFFQIIYQRSIPAWGGLVEGISGLIAALLFSIYSELNGTTLGISLSIGSFMKLFFYLLCFHYQEFFAVYKFYTCLFPLPLRTVKRFWKDIGRFIYSPLFQFSNTLVIVILLSSKGNHSSALNLVGYSIGQAVFQIVSVPGHVIGASAGIVSFRVSYFHYSQFENAFNIQLIGTFLSLVIALVLSMPLFVIPGKSLTEFIIVLDNIPNIVQGDFFESVREISYYFLGNGLLYALMLPVSQYLMITFSFPKIQQFSFFCSFLVGNAFIIGTFFGLDSLSNTDLIAELFAVNGLLLCCFLYEWLRVTDYEMKYERFPSLQVEKLLQLEKQEKVVVDSL
jgi:hypothetical protein